MHQSHCHAAEGGGVLTRCCVVCESFGMGLGGGSGGGGGLYSPGTMSLGGGSTVSRYKHATPGPLGLLMSSSSCSMRVAGGRGCLPCAASTSPTACLCFPVLLPSTPTQVSSSHCSRPLAL